MNGFQHLPSQQDQRFWVYTANRPSNGYQTWLKPPGINFVHILCIGGGGGGSSGLGSNAQVGGGGGGSGGMTDVFLPAYLVPDTLFINVGLGGTGGASTTSTTVRNIGTAGTFTYVSVHPTQGAGYSLCLALGGSAGNTAGTGGGGGGAASTANMPMSQVGLRTYQPGQGGTQGTISAGGSSLTAIHRITGGMGAWGAGGEGPTLRPPGEYSPLTYAPSDATQPGGGGINDLIKFIFTTGLPARSSTVASAQNSGNSGYGCGGPGGAGGNPNSGAGGKGGDGLVIITCG
jgi:hypothetical protein